MIAPSPLPSGPAGVRWRRFGPGDLATVVRMTHAADAVDRPEAPTAPALLTRAILCSPSVDPATGTAIAEGDGAPIAWGVVSRDPERRTDVRVRLPGLVVPAARRRGVGGALLSWQLDRGGALAADAPDATFGADAEIGNAAAEHLLAARGFSRERTFVHLRADLSAIPTAPMPAGFRSEPFAASLDDAVREAKSAAFAGHWRSQPETAASWAVHALGPQLRRDLSRVALDDSGAVAAFVLVQAESVGDADVSLVGTRADVRGRGHAAALLVEVMERCREEGRAGVEIDSDAENATGSVGVYERVGFVPTLRTGVWSRPIRRPRPPDRRG